MYWRRFAVSSIPLDDAKEFDAWMLKTWREKDDLMEQYVATGRFPPSANLLDNSKGVDGKPLMGSSNGFIETTVKTKYWWEWTKIFLVLVTWGLVANILAKMYYLVVYRSLGGWVQS
jgi:lysocardiolipin and lysophospholipid acyltransferase